MKTVGFACSALLAVAALRAGAADREAGPLVRAWITLLVAAGLALPRGALA